MESISDISDAAASSRPVQSERFGQSAQPMQHPSAPARSARKRRDIRSVAALIAMELAHVVFWLAQIVAYLALGSIALVGLAIAIPLFAELERWCARLLNRETPSGYHGGGFWRWLWMRVTQQEFWRMDLPLAISTLIVSAVSFAITVLAGIVAGVLFASPLIATPRHPVDLSFNSSHPWLVTRRVELWWMIPLGLVIVAFILLMCWLLGTARMWLTTTLSRDPNAEKVRTLTGEVSGLRSGRATLVDAYEVERTRIERDLHDGAQQRLIALTVQLGAAHMAVKSLHHEPPSQESSEEELTEQQRDQTIEHIDELLDQAQNQAEKALHELREVVHGIHPQVLTDLGLDAAVQDLCSRSGLDVHVTTSVSAEVSQPVSTAVYFALCELLTNVIKHADVTQADLDLHIDADGVQACVSDHGKGGAVSGKQGHTGLAGISQRLAVIGGTMTIDSRLEVGTTVTIQAPLQPPW